MVDYCIRFFGHCYVPGIHDKVWGWATTEHKCYIFWCKRGKKLSFKEHKDTIGKVMAIEKQKRKKYNAISTLNIEKTCPGFHKDFEQQLMMTILSDNFKGGQHNVS